MDAIFRINGNRVVTSPNAAGPWDARMQHGSAPAALVVWAAEAVPTPVPMQIARVTLDLMRPVPVAPLSIETEAGFAPDVWLLADQGYKPYSTTIEVMKPWYDANKDVAKRFVEASIIGWYNYLYGDNKPANAMIKKLNPEMTDDLLGYSVAKMKENGIVDSGDSLKNGIGAMSDERMASFFDKMVRAGVVKRDIDFRKAYTLRFINKGVGLNLRPKN